MGLTKIIPLLARASCSCPHKQIPLNALFFTVLIINITNNMYI
jgi:hypothetical protein